MEPVDQREKSERMGRIFIRNQEMEAVQMKVVAENHIAPPGMSQNVTLRRMSITNVCRT